MAERPRVDLPEAVGVHVGDEEPASIGADLDVLRSRLRTAVREIDGLPNRLVFEIDDDQLSGELAAGQGQPSVGRVVHVIDAAARHGHALDELHGVGVSEVEPLASFGDNDRVPTVGGEVQVVGIGDRDIGSASFAGSGVDGSEAVAVVVVDVERREVPRRGHMLRKRANVEVIDHLVGRGIDDVDGVRHAVGYVDQRARGCRLGAERVGAVMCVDVRSGGRVRSQELADGSERCARGPATDQEKPAVRIDERGIGLRGRKGSRVADAMRGHVDGDDRRLRLVGRVLAAGDDDFVPDGGGRSVGSGMREVADLGHPRGDRIE